jgi:GNAT superfamily N-acetyltransferase
MKIRKATIDDSPGLARIQVDSYRTAYVGFFPQAYLDRFSYVEQTRDWQDLLSSASNEVLFVAENRQGEIVGYALGRAETDPRATYDSTLAAMHVRRSQQRQGIGRRLLIAVVQELQAQGCRSLWLSTLAGNPVHAWYKRLGGVPIGELRYMVEEVEIVEIKYGWSDIDVLLQCANSGPEAAPLSSDDGEDATRC